MYRILLPLLLLCTSCFKSSPPVAKQQLNLNVPSDPATFDPRKGGDIISSMFHFMLYDGLTRLTVDGKPELALAESITYSPDHMQYTFKLRDAYWSNGKPIRSQDFENSWKAILDPSFPAANAHLLYPIRNAEKVKRGLVPPQELGISVPDEKTLIIELEHPTPYFLELISFCVFFPVQSDLDPKWEETVETSLTSSGPFLLKEWKRNNEIILVKNPHYHRANSVHISSIHISMVGNEMTALQMYEKGDLDILGDPLMSLPYEAIPVLQKKGDLHVRPVGASTFCSFNIQRPPFTNVKIRKAFAYAMNRAEIVHNITQLSETAALGVVPPVVKQGRNIAFFKDDDEENARQLFEEGLKELNLTREQLPKLTYHYTSSHSQQKIAQALQQQWKQVLGIDVSLQGVESKTLMSLLKMRDYDFAQSSWMVQYHDPMNVLERFKFADNVKNYPGWENARFKECLTRSNYASTPEERLSLIEEAEKTLLEEMPLAPIFHWSSAFIAKDYVKQFNLAPIGNGFFDQVNLEKEEGKQLR